MKVSGNTVFVLRDLQLIVTPFGKAKITILLSLKITAAALLLDYLP